MRPRRILLAVLGDPTEDDLLRLACDLVRPSKGTIYALYVIEVPRQFPVDAEMAEEVARGDEVLRRVERALAGMKCSVAAELLQARDAGAAIVKEAVEREVDHILMGVSYRQRFGAFSLGRTITYVLQEAPCPVLVVRLPLGIRRVHENGAQRLPRGVARP